MNIMMLGDIVGSAGRAAACAAVARARASGQADVVIANAENAAGGRGITPAIADDLFHAGIDAITLGDHVWDQKDLAPRLPQDRRLIRPLNCAPDCPGFGWSTLSTPAGKVTVVSLLGRVFLPPVADCPFRAFDRFWNELPAGHGPVIVDVHAEATSEKIALGWHLDGRANIVAGTHTHVQTSDERILPRGTAYITDLGMTGPSDSVLGRSVATVLRKFITGMPVKMEVSENSPVAEGIRVELTPSGMAVRIERFREIPS
ncbi:MAG: YmdB family metallophosphoesterase [Kiritimatiellae bacterium]|nr:YmdB family metallophosphoesterase [Kiritimatiellia bacterium]